MRKLIAAAAAATLLAGCGTAAMTKATPRAGAAPAAKAKADAFLYIQYVTANGLMGSSFDAPPNHRVRLQARTSAPWNAQLDWSWRAWGPIFGFNDRADWTTPMSEGTYTVDVQVRDREGGFDWKTLYFRVKKDATFAEAEIGEAEKAGAKGADKPGGK